MLDQQVRLLPRGWYEGGAGESIASWPAGMPEFLLWRLRTTFQSLEELVRWSIDSRTSFHNLQVWSRTFALISAVSSLILSRDSGEGRADRSLFRSLISSRISGEKEVYPICGSKLGHYRKALH